MCENWRFALEQMKSAICKDDTKAIERFLSVGMDVNSKLNDEINLLEFAIEMGFDESAILLAHHGGQVRFLYGEINCDVILEHAVYHDRPVLVKWLLENGHDVNATSSERSLLHLTQSTEVAEMLLAKGLELEVKDNIGSTPLHNSAVLGNVDLMATLIKHGANVDSTNKEGLTPLLSLILNPVVDHIRECAKILLANGADVNARLADGRSILHHVGRVHFDGTALAEFVEEVMEYDVDVNARDNKCQTPLFNFERPALVEKYLRRGADINVESNKGLTPLETACLKMAYRVESKRKHSVVLFVKHIIKLKSSGFRVSKKNLVCAEFIVRANNVRGQPLDENLENYDRACALELDKLKMNLCISPKKFLTSRYPSYLLNAERSRKLEEMSDGDYPIYGPMLRDKFKRDKKIFRLSEPCKILLSKSQLRPTLPNEIWERIVSHLTMTDLRGFS